jgi:PAS domain S-box-containing protein/putative nucleotidyltransferase with HDIG domain
MGKQDRIQEQLCEEIKKLRQQIAELEASEAKHKRTEKAEEELRLEKKFTDTALNSQWDTFFVFNPTSGQAIRWNDEFRRVSGYTDEEISKLKAPESYYSPQDQKKAAVASQEILKGEKHVFEMALITKSGEKIPFEYNSNVIEGKKQGEYYIVSIGRDVRERKRAEEELRKREAHQALVLNSLPMAFYVAQPFGDYGGTWVSNQIGKIAGFIAEEFMNNIHLWASRLHPDDQERVLENFKKITENDAIEIEYRWQTADGSYRWLHDSGVLIRDKEGKPIEIVGTWFDITDRKQAEKELEESFEKLQKAVSANIQLMAMTVEIRDPYTAGHQKRVADLARAIAKRMALSKERIEGIYMAGVIHDIGKISVPSEILSKPGKLTEMEFNLIKSHPQIGFDILKEIEFPWPIANIVLQHHERLNGQGYPQGLAGDSILLEAKIMGVADVVEAMASHRPYRPAHGIEEALTEIEKHIGILYDAEVVKACIQLFTEGEFEFKP